MGLMQCKYEKPKEVLDDHGPVVTRDHGLVITMVMTMSWQSKMFSANIAEAITAMTVSQPTYNGP